MPPIRGPSNPPAMGQESYLTRDLLQNQGLQRKPRVWDHHGVKPKVCGQTREKRRVRMRKVLQNGWTRENNFLQNDPRNRAYIGLEANHFIGEISTGMPSKYPKKWCFI
jgi:hypothetical protein